MHPVSFALFSCACGRGLVFLFRSIRELLPSLRAPEITENGNEIPEIVDPEVNVVAKVSKSVLSQLRQ
jgi:hypothetical protein